MLAEQFGGTGTMMAYHQYMRVHGVQRGGSVQQRFALFHRRSGHIDIQNGPAEMFCGQFKGHARAGRILKEEIDDGAATQPVGIGWWRGRVGLNQIGKHVAAVNQRHDLDRGKTLDPEKMTM